MKKIKWKQVPFMKPGERHIHEKTISNPGAYRYAKGHYVGRPYLKYASSKWEMGYIDFYEILLNHLKYRPDVTLLEFGVYTGESMKYFRDYFTHPDAKIVGFDHHPCEFYGHDWLAEVKGIPNSEHAGDKYDGPTHNVVFYHGEQKHLDEVEDCCKVHGPFDVIIDDASHYPDITENVFRVAWNHLKENGIYIIEDIAEKDIRHLMDEITVTRQGRGCVVRPTGFGPAGGGGECVNLVLLKSKDSITGLDERLTEE